MTNYVQDMLDPITKQVDLPPELARLYALLALVKGEDATLEDVHDAWAVWCDVDRPEHRSLVPFDDLSDDVQALDAPYQQAIVNAARGLWKRNGAEMDNRRADMAPCSNPNCQCHKETTT